MSTQWEDIDSELLAKRARQLAERRETDEGSRKVITLLEFTMMNSLFAIDLARVEGVTRINDIFSIPMTPKHIQGVIRRRGQTIALVSLPHFFHPEYEALIDADFAVIAQAKGKRFAIQVEEIEGVLHVTEDEMRPVPDNYDGAQAPYLKSVTKAGTVVLDPDMLILSDRFGTSQVKG